ncbi:MAG: 50S ribosomal protein L21e [Candidatus Micrarchaeota archaeon]
MKRSHGGFSKESRVLKSEKTPVSRRLASFQIGSVVRLVFNPSFLQGRPNALRFNNKAGVVVGKQGGSFVMEFADGGKKKKLVVANVHLKKA